MEKTAGGGEAVVAEAPASDCDGRGGSSLPPRLTREEKSTHWSEGQRVAK